MVKKEKIIKEEWQCVLTPYCRVQRLSLSTKEKTITQKGNIFSCLADLSYALKVGWVHFHICFGLPLQVPVYSRDVSVQRGTQHPLDRLGIWKTWQRSSSQMQKESENRFCPAQEPGIKCGCSCSAPSKVHIIIKINVKPLCSCRPLSSYTKVPNSALPVQLHWCTSGTESDVRRLAEFRWNVKHHKRILL